MDEGISEIASLKANPETKVGTCLETVTGIHTAATAWTTA
jgi:hypothetical protein